MKPITFDRFARGLVFVAVLFAAYGCFSYLSPVLIPFLVAGVAAYLLNPVCDFFQHTCRLRFRVVSVLLTLVLAIGGIVGVLWLCIPPIFDECGHFSVVLRHYFESEADKESVSYVVRNIFKEGARSTNLMSFVESDDFRVVLKTALPRLWNLLMSTAGLVVSFVSSCIGLLYLFFLLLDYNRYAKIWITFVPHRYRTFARQFFNDVTFYLCGYFRGQLLIALSNCVLFTLGFFLVGFPMPIALGCFIGIISFVPYLQVAGLLPCALLALLRTAETGQNFWLLIGGALAVYLVVQIIQDVIVTPRIMGRIMGLSPAIILLALSVGAFVGGIGGLIVALPITTLAMAYYKRYVVKEPDSDLPCGEKA